MHAATPRIGIQTTIFSEHEVLEDCCHLILPFRYFGEKNVKIMKKLRVLFTKYIICTVF